MLLGTILCQISDCCSVSNFCHLFDYLWMLSEFFFDKRVTNLLLVWDNCVVQQDAFYPHQGYKQGNFYKTLRLLLIGRPVRDGKDTTYLQMAQIATLQFYLTVFLSRLRATLRFYAERDCKSEVCTRCELWNYRITKNIGTKHLLLFEDLCEEFFRSKTFNDIAVAGKQRELSIFYVRHN